MFQSDYIRRLIEQLGKALRAITNAEETGDHRQAEGLIDSSGKAILGFDLNLLNALDDEDLLRFFKPGAELDAAKCLAAGLLLHEKVRNDGDTISEASRNRMLNRAAYLLLTALNESETLRQSQYAGALPPILSKIPVGRRSASVMRELTEFYRHNQAFAKVEDVIFEQLEYRQITAREAQDLLKQLLHFNDAQLINGNLPRQEILEAIAELERRPTK